MAGAHRLKPASPPVIPRAASAAVAALSITLVAGAGAGMARAVPEQGGVNPYDQGPEQGGTSPGADGATQGGTTPPTPVQPPGEGSLPAPPQEAPYQPYVPAPSFPDNYSPDLPLRPPQPAPPVRPIAPPPNMIRVGNFITPIPDGMSERDVNSINAWSAYGEAKIAQGLISMGVPEDKASRQAAATIIGVMAGGTAGAVTLGVPAMVVGGVAGAAVGAGIGYVVGGAVAPPFTPGAPTPSAFGGMGIGAAVGAGVGGAGLGLAAAGVGAAIGGTFGGLIAYALGAGDPGANPREPWLPPETPQRAPKTHSDGHHQFQVRLPAEQAHKAGLPAVDYTVTHRGDVKVDVGGTKVGWTSEQANAPLNMLGTARPVVDRETRRLTHQGVSALQQALPGVRVAW